MDKNWREIRQDKKRLREKKNNRPQVLRQNIIVTDTTVLSLAEKTRGSSTIDVSRIYTNRKSEEN